MFNPTLRKLYWKFFALTVLIGCLALLRSDYIPVVQASTCDVNFAQDTYACTNHLPTREGADPYTCNTYPGQLECCYNTYVNTYNSCVLQNGPIGATMLAPMSEPAPDPDAQQPTLIEQRIRSCRMFNAGLNTRYYDCTEDGGTHDFCCIMAYAPIQQ
jgi:hypothetical protein